MISQRLCFLGLSTGLLAGIALAAMTHVPLKVKTGAWSGFLGCGRSQVIKKQTRHRKKMPSSFLFQVSQ